MEVFRAVDVAVHRLPRKGVDWGATRTHAHTGAPAEPVRRPVLLYTPGGGDARTLGTGTAEELGSELLARGQECLLVGDGAVRYQDVLRDVARVDTSDIVNAYPSAASLVDLAHPRALREEFVPATDLTPLYLRRSDAEIAWTQREVV